MNPTSPFSLALVAIVALSILGLPVGHAMIGGSILYLFLANLDMGTAAEQLLNGMNTSFLLLAIPLFILAAEFMNTGSILFQPINGALNVETLLFHFSSSTAVPLADEIMRIIDSTREGSM